MPDPAFHGKILNGKFKLKKPNEFKIWLEGMEGKEVVLSVKERKKFRKRTINQNAFMWAYYRIIIEELGLNETAEMLHEKLKARILGTENVWVFDRNVTMTVKGTSDMDKVQMTEYLNQVEALTGVPVPNPDEIFKL